LIIVLGSALVQADQLAQALALSQAHVARSRQEAGCIAHAVHQDTGNPARLVFVEQWASQEALWDHFKVPASREFAKALGALCAAAPRIDIYEGQPVQMPGKGEASSTAPGR
jgi:quinol monooxygenase YgiN